jgi:alkyldihydroxyacetonephosphate synthase
MRREQVFWGWGEPGSGPGLPDHAAGFLREHLGVTGEVVDRPVALADVELAEPALDAGVRERLAATGELRDDREARVLRCRGKSYLDLLAQRAGRCAGAPDAVVAPRHHAGVLEVLRVCAEAGVAVVPFGGGTSVVGGLEPERGGRQALVSLDLGGMDALTGVDERSLIATFEPGMRLPEAEHALAARGLTLGHFPQSFEWASVGGSVATRSSGQASTGYGRIDANVVSVRCATPVGEVSTLDAPGSAAGPSLRELLVGSEGALGVLTEVALRVAPAPRARRYEGWAFASFDEGCEALRALEQAGAAPTVARLSDEAETRMSLALAGGGAKVAAGRALMRARGYTAPCLAITGFEGTPEEVARRRAAAARILRRAGGMGLGPAPGHSWLHGRYGGPHLRDDLLDRGVLVETLETATTWSNLGRLHRAVASALREHAPLVVCHVSHLYPTGASLYFTVLGPRDAADPEGQWRAAKAAASDAIVAAQGTITHHHAVGRDHAPWLGAEVGGLGLDLLRGAKERLDPAGILNPGVLLRAEAARPG